MNPVQRIAIIGTLLSLVLGANASAQWNIARFDAEPNRVYATFGLDPAFVPAVGYGRVMSIFGHPVQVGVDGGVVIAEVDARDFRGRIHFLTSIANWRSLYLTGSTALIARGTDNSIYSGDNFGADFTGAIGVYRTGWFVAGEFGIDKAGVLERVGAAIKSLSRAKEENPASVTILILQEVSMTPQSMVDLQTNQKAVNYWITVEEVLENDEKRDEVFRLLQI